MTDSEASLASRTFTEVPIHETPFEHLAIRRVDSVQEYVDARLSLSSRPSARELEEGFPQNLVRALSNERHHHHHHPEKHPNKHDNSDGDDIRKEKQGNVDASSSEVEEILYVSGTLNSCISVHPYVTSFIRSIGKKEILEVQLTSRVLENGP